MKPNLFDFATSELSQDGVFCWMAQWAGPAHAACDPALHALGLGFLGAMFKKAACDMPQIRQLEVKRQYDRIDILIRINDSVDILIEDKAGTREHSNQLARNLAKLQAEGDRARQVLPLYIQTGEQCGYSGILEAGYKVLLRHELLALLDDYAAKGGRDSIALDFREHLTRIEGKVQAFRSHCVADWDAQYGWQGFYGELSRYFSDGSWQYVSNPAGGFWAFDWNWRNGEGGSAYLQIEQDKLCFKWEFEDAAMGSSAELRQVWLSKILKAAEGRDVSISKPNKWRAGKTMTVAVMKDYRVVDSRGVIDMEQTISRLRIASDVLAHSMRL